MLETSSNNNNLAQIGVKSRRRYRKPERELCKKQIRKMIIEDCLSNDEIADKLQISQRSCDRWVREIFEQDVNLLAKVEGDAEAVRQIAIFRHRVNQFMCELLNDIARNKDVNSHDRIAAYNTCCEMAEAISNTFLEGPAAIARRYEFYHIRLQGPSKFLVNVTSPDNGMLVSPAEEEKEKGEEQQVKNKPFLASGDKDYPDIL
jgi:hypothetical protein